MEGLLLRSILVSGFGLIALLAAQRASASVRHAIVTATLFGLLLMPIMQALIPEVSLPVLPSDNISVSVERTAHGRLSTVATAPAVVQPLTPRAGVDWTWFWLLGCGIGGVRLGCGWGLLIWRLRRACRLQDFGCIPPVFESDAVAVPVTAWIGRSFIVLPPAWREWPQERLSIVLKHEEAHVRRGDWFSLVAARLVLAIFWPNPLVWLLAHQQKGLAEQAADSLVVSEGVPAWRYADELLAIAQEARATGLPLALSMGRRAEVARRIDMLLKQKNLDRWDRRWLRSGVFAGAVLVAVPVAVCGFTAPIQTPTVQSAPAPSLEQRLKPLSDTQFLLSCWMYKPSALSDLPGPKKFPKEPVRLEKGLELLSSPRIRTLDGMEATLSFTTSEGDDGTRIQVLPERADHGFVSLVVSVARPVPGKPDQWSQVVASRVLVRSNEWLAMSVPAPGGSTLKQLFLVKTEEFLSDGVGPQASP